jgi:hypothetical protein
MTGATAAGAARRRRPAAAAAAAVLATTASLLAAPASAQVPFDCNSFLALVVGSNVTNSSLTVNRAQTVWIEERSYATGALLRRQALRNVSAPGAPACTLAVAAPSGTLTGSASESWQYNTDGLPQLSADGSVAVLPCFDISAGNPMDLNADKTIAIIDGNGIVNYTTALASTYTGVYGPAGMRQAATVNGSNFWMSGVAETHYGFRYVSSPDAGTSIGILGSGNDMFQPGFGDARGVGVFEGRLYGSTTNLDNTPGVFSIGVGLPVTETATWTMLTGVPVSWTFVFQETDSLWVAVDDPAFPKGTLVHYVRNAATNVWVQERNVTLETINPVYSVSGRWQDVPFDSRRFFLLSSSATRVYRYVPSTGSLDAIYNLTDYYNPATTAVRGIAFAPRAVGACSPTPSQTSTASQTPSNSQTGTSSASQTRTPSSSQTRTPSSTQTGTPSQSQTRTPSPSQTRTPSSSQTRTPSQSQTRTPSASQTRTPSSSQTRTPSSSQTRTPTASQTPTATASATGTASSKPVNCTSYVIVIVGDGAGYEMKDRAQKIFIEQREAGTNLLMRKTLLRFANAGLDAPACTLGVGIKERGDDGGDAWQYNTDGLPTSSVNGNFASIFCFDAPFNSTMTMNTNKTIASIDVFGNVVYSRSLTDTYTGVFGPAGIRQAVTIAGGSFWLSGMSDNYWGFRYLASLGDGVTTPILGFSDPNAPGYNDARGIAIFGGNLYGGTTSLDGANAGIFQIGTGLPTTEVASWTMLQGIPTPWTFVFENATSLWVSLDSPSYQLGTFARYTLNTGTGVWAISPGFVQQVTSSYPLYSLTGRMEAPASDPYGDPVWTLYASSPVALYRYVPSTDPGPISVYNVSTFYPGSVATALRGVALMGPRAGSCFPTLSATATSSATAQPSSSPSGTPSGTPSSSQTRTPSASQTGTQSGTGTRTRTGTPATTATPSSSPATTSSSTATTTGSRTGTATATQSGTRTQTGTPSSTSTGSSTGTATSSQTRTPSSSQTRTSSSSQTRTPSSTQTGTSSSSQTRTPSSSQTGTSSSSQTRTPSSSQTRTPSSSQTRTPSSSQTRTGSSSQTGTGSATQTRTGTGSSSQTGTPSRSRTSSASNTQSASPSQTGSSSQTGTASRSGTRTGSRSSTASVSGTPPPTSSATPSPSVNLAATTNLVLVRVGDSVTNLGNTAPGTALPVTYDLITWDFSTWRSVPLPKTTSADGTRRACTLSYSAATNPSIDYYLDTEGLPSLAAVTKNFVVVPCHGSPPGASQRNLLWDTNTIAMLNIRAGIETIPLAGFTGARGTQTGLRQAVTANGTEFWLTGVALNNYGVRWLPNRTSLNSIHIHGQTLYPNGRYQAGTYDSRALTMWGGELFMSSSWIAEPNENGNVYPYTPW